MTPTTYTKPVRLAIVGGTGLYHIDGLHPVAKLRIETPWGHPSAHITVAETEKGTPVAFLPRHGLHHEFNPSNVPSRANIAALKSIGVRAIVAFSAVGSLQEHIKPRDFVLPNQIIDRTKGIRPSTFFDEGLVAHAGFGDPFCAKLSDFLSKNVNVLEGEYKGQPSVVHHATAGKDVVLVCMEGPAFSTRAESRLYRSWEGSVINMSALPEAKLAREAEISYQMICMSTDYDAWRDGEEPVTVESVMGHLKSNRENASRVCKAIIQPLLDEIEAGRIGSDLEGSMRYAVSTLPAGRSPEAIEKLEFLLPGYYS